MFQLQLLERRDAGAAPSEPEPYPFDLEDAHFHSGVNHPGEIHGLAFTGQNAGITASDVNAALLEEISLYAHAYFRLFVDSGAFSEVTFGRAGRTVVAPISHEEWLERLGLYRRLCDLLCPEQLFLVAPDCVGDQEETLCRLERYAPQVRELVRIGANLIVPVQKGALPMAEFWWRELEVLGLAEPRAIAGIPMKKDATTVEDLAVFCGHLGLGARVHLLGLGPNSRRFLPAMRAVALGCPWARASSDSVTIRAKVGRTNGKNGGPRALTAARDAVVAEGRKGGHEVKRWALIRVGNEEHRRRLQAARRAGWYDPELESAPGVPLGPGGLHYGPGGPFGDE